MPRFAIAAATLTVSLVVGFTVGLVSLSLADETATVRADSETTARPDFTPCQDTLPVAAPDDAIVLYDGQGTNLFLSMEGGPIDWPVEDGTLVSTRGQRRTNHLVSKLHFRDADIHVEFLLPDKTSGNSGVYIHGNYELQIFNSFGKGEPSMEDIGAVYGFAKPLVNAGRKPGDWQVYDIRYRAPRRDAAGKVVRQGSLTAWLNGAMRPTGHDIRRTTLTLASVPVWNDALPAGDLEAPVADDDGSGLPARSRQSGPLPQRLGPSAGRQGLPLRALSRIRWDTFTLPREAQH